MGTATYGGKCFKERTRVGGERPMGAAAIHPGVMPEPPVPWKYRWGHGWVRVGVRVGTGGLRTRHPIIQATCAPSNR